MSLHQQNHSQCSLLRHIITSSAFLTCLPSVPVRRNIGGVSSFVFFFSVIGYYKINMREGVSAGTYFSGSDKQQVAKYNIKLFVVFLIIRKILKSPFNRMMGLENFERITLEGSPVFLQSSVSTAEVSQPQQLQF